MYVPAYNRCLIRNSVSTFWGFHSLPTAKVEAVDPLHPDDQNAFVELFDTVATTDTSRYICVPEALRFPHTVCGGEEGVRHIVKISRIMEEKL
jgi:hypothetical protein